MQFVCDDVTEAKDVLIKCGIADPGPLNGHRDSSQRSRFIAEVEDFMVMLERLDGDSNVNPTFAAVNLSKIPSVSPEEAGNAASQATQIRKLQEQMASVMKALNDHEENIDSLMQIQSSSASSYASVVGQNSRKNDNVMPGPSKEDSGAKDAPHSPRQIQSSRDVKQKYTDSEGFARQRASYHKDEKNYKRDQKRVTGKNTDTNRLRGEPQKTDMVVKYVQKDCLEDDMHEFLIENDITVWPEDILLISHQDHSSNTFKVKILKSDMDKMLDEDIWSTGIECSEWVPRKRNYPGK